MKLISFKRHRFPPEIIRYAIWLYARFTLSFRDVEELLAERGVDASYETVRRGSSGSDLRSPQISAAHGHGRVIIGTSTKW